MAHAPSLVHVWALTGALAAGASACASSISPVREPCVDDGQCLGDERCIAGACTAGAPAPCTTDLECDLAAGELCTNGACVAPPQQAPGTCEQTRECPVDSFCNTNTHACEPMPAGWCRVSGQCPSNAPVCDNGGTTATPGSCVACVTAADCEGGGSCVDNACEAPPAPPVDCPPNASLVPGSTTACQCDIGFTPDVAANTCAREEAPPEATCVPNASPVPGTGQCRCNGGFEPNADGSACVPESAPPPPPPPDGGDPPPPPPPPDDGGDDGCGPNSVPVFFLCVCLPGYVVSPAGDGCVLDDGGGGGGGDECPPNSTLEGDGFCYCDPGFVVNAAGDGCEIDICEANGWYGDGEFCDDCPYFDPDCG